jgi:hypothetical protein
MAGRTRPFFFRSKKFSQRDRHHVANAGDTPIAINRDAISESGPVPAGGTKMTSIENSGSAQTASTKSTRLRRALMGTAFAAVAMLSLGAGSTPAQAYWYHYGWYHPYYHYYHPYYGWYGYPAYYGGWGYGWRGGWGWHGGWGWRHGYYHHW